MEHINKNNINQKIKNFILNAIQIPDLRDDDNLFETGIVNSLFAVQLLTFLEKSFNIRVSPEDLLMENFQSVDSATSFVLHKQSV
ncbi:MAG TPA: acyl carrier protein [Ignavibacteriaceae bacterium]|nr:acyl carrier protein [Ignavibacteriaceae bacterium]